MEMLVLTQFIVFPRMPRDYNEDEDPAARRRKKKRRVLIGSYVSCIYVSLSVFSLGHMFSLHQPVEFVACNRIRLAACHLYANLTC